MSVKMIDITNKRDIIRIAVAEGKIKLKKETIKLISEKKIKKGDVFSVATVAAISAIKKTPEIIPLCHPISITSTNVEFETYDNEIKVIVTVKAFAKTGVEMEALAGVTAALLNIWDMTKAYEKDELGQYPHTVVTDIKVVRKEKIEV